MSHYTEEQMREMEPPRLETIEDLTTYLQMLEGEADDYGKCVYCMSLAAWAAFNFMASKIGATGFQASCADMAFVTKVRGLKHGWRLIDYGNLLYPQYCDETEMPGWETHLRQNIDTLGLAAEKLLSQESKFVAESVTQHWRMLVEMRNTYLATKGAENEHQAD